VGWAVGRRREVTLRGRKRWRTVIGRGWQEAARDCWGRQFP
jgi:hypothetical protein